MKPIYFSFVLVQLVSIAGFHISPSTLYCCPNRYDEFHLLYDCITDRLKLSDISYPFNNSLLLVTFVDDKILDYAAYGIAVNAVYASIQGYSIIIINQEKWKYSEVEDPRWNKVKILYDLLDPLSGQARHVEYIVWMDADLVIMNFSLNLIGLFLEHSEADMILSADMADSPTIANTGLIMVRNTHWSREFLRTWWSRYDRRECCDQNALSWLYTDLSEEERKKFSILPSDAVNTNFPSWKNQRPQNAVLHLAGVTSLLRQPVFRYAWSTVCSAVIISPPTSHIISSSDAVPNILGRDDMSTATDWNDRETRDTLVFNLTSLPLQLGLTREKLVEFVLSLPNSRLQSLTRLQEELPLLSSPSSSSPSVVSADIIRVLQHRLEDIMKTEESESEMQRDRESGRLSDRKVMMTVSISGDKDGDTSLSVRDVNLLLQQKAHKVRLWIFQAWRQLSNKQFLDCKNDELECVQLLERLETLREAISAGYDTVFRMNELSDYNRLHKLELLETHINPLLETLSVYIPSTLRHRYYYYKFKYEEMLSIEYINNNQTRCVQHLEISYKLWKLMAINNYFGSNYVTVEPYKEGIKVMTQLASLLCLKGKNRRGRGVFATAVRYYNQTIENFRGNILATSQIIQSTELSYAELLVNYGLCYYYDTTNKREKKSYLKAMEMLLSAAISLMERHGVTTSESYETGMNLFQEIRSV